MAAQQCSPWDDVTKAPLETSASDGVYPNRGIGHPDDRQSPHRSRFDASAPGPPAARPLNEASSSFRAVQAASMRLQSRLDRGTPYPDPWSDFDNPTYRQGYQEYPPGLGGPASPRQEYQEDASSWDNHVLGSQSDVVQPHATTGCQRVSYLKDWVEDDIYHCRDRLSQTLEDLSHVRHVYSPDRLEHYRVYDEEY